jgi:hypothetical protein
MNRALIAIVTGCILSVGCSANTDAERVGASDEDLIGGGCSMSQIRVLQQGCRDSCPNGSAGIDHCWPSTMIAGANVFLDVSEGGICVCN